MLQLPSSNISGIVCRQGTQASLPLGLPLSEYQPQHQYPHPDHNYRPTVHGMYGPPCKYWTTPLISLAADVELIAIAPISISIPQNMPESPGIA